MEYAAFPSLFWKGEPEPFSSLCPFPGGRKGGRHGARGREKDRLSLALPCRLLGKDGFRSAFSRVGRDTNDEEKRREACPFWRGEGRVRPCPLQLGGEKDRSLFGKGSMDCQAIPTPSSRGGLSFVRPVFLYIMKEKKMVGI